MQVDLNPGSVFSVLHRTQSHTSLIYPVAQKRKCRDIHKEGGFATLRDAFHQGSIQSRFLSGNQGLSLPQTKHVLLWVSVSSSVNEEAGADDVQGGMSQDLLACLTG